MIQFPETAKREWDVVADAANAEVRLRQKIERDTRVEGETERLRIRHEAALIFQQELDADQTPVLEMMTLTDFRTTPTLAPADMIEGVMKENGLTVMLGPSGSGKSTLALQMIHSLSTGDAWLGQPTTQITGATGIMAYDMDASMVLDWMDGFPNFNPDSVSVVNAYKRGHPLGVPAIRSQIVEHWKSMNVEVVVIDSFSASFFGVDQNDAAATMAHYRDLKLFALTEVEAKALIVIAHSTESAPGRARGSSVHQDVADSIVAVSSNPVGERKVEMVKYRAARGKHKMDPVVVTPPDNVTHLVSLDLGAMRMASMHLPPGAVAAAFPDLPDPTSAPDLEVEDEEDDL